MQPPTHEQKFLLKGREIFDRAYSRLSRPLAELSFSWLQLWDCYRDVEWKKINGNFCLFLTFEESAAYGVPSFPETN